jgi:serine/threonine protein kinase
MTGKTSADESWSDALDIKSAGRVMESLMRSDAEAQGDAAGPFPDIEGYVFDRRLGAGGGGEVYRAVKAGSDHILAIKVLQQRIGTTAAAKRAWRELDVLAQLRLPYVPRLIDHGIWNGRMYLVTEFVEGLNLVGYCETGRKDRAARVQLLARVADVVHSLHERGVIHRDIKPANVLVDAGGQPVLIDLGIATLLSRDAMETLTADGVPIGSPAFMAPEQARGENEVVSTRSDVYGLGATGFLLLTGQTPHNMEATLHEAIRRVAHEPPRAPRELDPTLPRSLAAVLAKAAARNPGDRYASAAEFAMDLRRWLTHEPVEAGGLSFGQWLGRLVARHPVASTAAACTIVAVSMLIGTTISVWWINQRPYRMLSDASDPALVRLISRNNNVLHEWDTGFRSGECVARLMTRDAAFGGGRVGVIAFSKDTDNPFAGQLCLIDPKDPGTPRWLSGNGPPKIQMPPPISHVEGEHFNIDWMRVEEVFPESPGLEIIAVHSHAPHSPNVIRIHRADGEILYQAWHDGNIHTAYWWSGKGLLVLCGRNSEATWEDRDPVGAAFSEPPLVVFAIRPQLGAVHDQWIRTPGGRGQYQPAWYRGILPVAHHKQLHEAGDLELHLRPHLGLNRDVAQLQVTLAIRKGTQTQSVNFILDAEGMEVPRTRYAGDSYLSDPQLPDWQEIVVGALPPIRER